MKLFSHRVHNITAADWQGHRAVLQTAPTLVAMVFIIRSMADAWTTSHRITHPEGRRPCIFCGASGVIAETESFLHYQSCSKIANPTLDILRLLRHRGPFRPLGALGIDQDALRFVYILTKTYHSFKDRTIPVPADVTLSAVRAAHRRFLKC